MDSRKNLEESISKISNEFIIETLKYDEESNSWMRWLNFLPKVAVVILAVGFVGTASVIAATNYERLKEITVDKDVIYFGGYDKELNPEEDESVHVVGAGELLSTQSEQGSKKDLWLEKNVETYADGDVITKYSFESYKNAVDFFGIDSNFRNLPGMTESVSANDFRKEETMQAGEGLVRMDLVNTTIISCFQLNVGSYKVVEHYVVGAVGKNAFLVENLYEAGNERTYVNTNGMEFTLVDGYETENEETREKFTKVLLGSDHYFGVISFRGMSDADIHGVFDCFEVNYVAPEYEHYYGN